MSKNDAELQKAYRQTRRTDPPEIDWPKAIASIPQHTKDEILRRIAKNTKPS